MMTYMKKFFGIFKKEWLNWLLKLNHWALFFMAIFLGVTGWLGCTAFSVPNLMKDVMDFAFPVAEIDAGAGARFILSRVIRGQMFQYHFLIGVIMYAAMIIGIALAFTKNGIKKNPITILFFISMTLLLVSGWFRYYRGTLPLMEIGYYRGLFRNIHHYSAWALLWTTVAHLIHMIYLNSSKRYQHIISRMFSSGKFMLKTILCFLLIGASLNGIPAYASSIYEQLSTNVKMIPPLEDGDDDIFLKGVIPSSKESVEVLADFYWAKKCTNSLDGVVLWNNKERFCHSRRFALLLELKQHKNNKEASQAYQTIVMAERIQNCGSSGDIKTFLKDIQH